ncbi:MAG: response regulator transcription factor [Oscillospiraceae bacterium]
MRLLIAEDEKELSNALAAVLKHNNYSVDTVYDGADAYDFALSGNYDGIILDIMMPKMDGLEVLSKLRSGGINVPVLLLTAKSEVEDRVKGLDAGADDYLTKPFAMSELLARIRAMTRRSSQLSSNELSFGDITLSRATYELVGEKGSVRLGSKEFQMLEYMMTNPNMLISTEKFMEKIWGFDSETEMSVVWVYISYLRKRLSTVGSKVVIRAARGTGYTLEVPDA